MAKGLLIVGGARTTSTYALAAFRVFRLSRSMRFHRSSPLPLAMEASTALKFELELVIKKAAVSKDASAFISACSGEMSDASREFSSVHIFKYSGRPTATSQR